MKEDNLSEWQPTEWVKAQLGSIGYTVAEAKEANNRRIRMNESARKNEVIE